MPDLKLSCTVGGTIASVRVGIQFEHPGNREPTFESYELEGPCSIPLPAGAMPTFLRVTPLVPGYWAVCRTEFDLELTIDCPPLPRDGPIGWWHRAVGITCSDLRRGTGIKVGVIDGSLDTNHADSGIQSFINLGRLSDRKNGTANTREHIHHAVQVCGLMGYCLTTREGYQGIAPGAEYYFVSAKHEDDNSGLRPTLVSNAIIHLSKKVECDIVSVSAGDCCSPLLGIRDAVRLARHCGTICIFSGGNTHGPVMYPAKYPEILAVSACGKSDYAPPGTHCHFVERVAGTVRRGDFYSWAGNCHGRGINLMAPGAGVICTENHFCSEAVMGTSYAAPIAAGVAAILLSRNSQYLGQDRSQRRADVARRCLLKACDKMDFNETIAGSGIPVV